MSLVNLLPKDYAARRAQKRSNVLCFVLFALVMAGVLSAAVWSEKNHRHTRQVRRRVNRAYQDAARLIEQMQGLEASKRELLDRFTMTAGLLESVPRSYLLAVITNALPEGASIRQFELKTKARKDPSSPVANTRYAQAANRQKTGTGPTKNDVIITLTGFARTDADVGRFITTMSRCPLVEPVEFIYIQETEVELVEVSDDGKQRKAVRIPAREFRVVIRLRPDADVTRLAGQAPGAAAERHARFAASDLGTIQ